MEDIRIGRKTKTITRMVQLFASYTVAVDEDPKRTVLIFQASPNSNLLVYPNNPPNDQYAFWAIAGGGPLVFDIRTHGDIVTKRWYGTTPSQSDIAVITEGRLEEE